MRGADDRHAEAAQHFHNALFGFGIEMAGGFIEYQGPGLPIQRPGQQDALGLAARQVGAHVSNLRRHAHGKPAHFLVHCHQARNFVDKSGVGGRIEESDEMLCST